MSHGFNRLLQQLERRMVLATAISSGEAVTGTITGNSDSYTFTAISGGSIVGSMGTTSGSMNPQIQIFGPNGAPLGDASAFNQGIATLTVTAPSSGTYTAVATSSNGFGGDYKLAVASVPALQVTDADGGPISSGQTISGNINGDLDTFTFSAVSGGSIVGSMGTTNGSMNPQIQIFGPNGALLDDAGAFNQGIATLTVTAPVTGVYTAVATSSNGFSGDYKLAVAAMPALQVTDADGGAISSGQTINGNIDGDLDTFTFSAVSGGSIVGSMGTTSGSMNPQIQIFGPNGALLGDAFAFNQGIATLTVTAPTSGTYTAVATSANGFSGNYSLTMTAVGGTSLATLSSDGVLLITGTSGPDQIKVRSRGGSTVVSVGNLTESFARSAVESLSISTGLGNDSINTIDSARPALIDAGGGNDLVSCGAANDTVSGGSENDTINGNGGNDYLKGNGGKNRLNGGDDNDRLRGSNGVDLLYGGQGRDKLYGQAGDDWLYGGGNNDVMYAGAGNDQVFGEGSGDHLHGDSGDDTLNGGSSADNLYGGTGTDTRGDDDALDNVTSVEL